MLSLSKLLALNLVFQTINSYKLNEALTLRVIKVFDGTDSIYYNYTSLPFCHENEINTVDPPFDLAQSILGEHRVISPIKIKVLSEVQCSIVCRKLLDSSNSLVLNKLSNSEAKISYMLENMKVVSDKVQFNNDEFPIFDKKLNIFYSHMFFKIFYTVQSEEVILVKVTATVKSLQSIDLERCRENMLNPFIVKNDIFQSYDVVWEKITNDHEMSSSILGNDRNQIYSTFYLVSIFLITMVLIYLFIYRIIKRDIEYYNVQDSMFEAGWKLLYGDVFRAPKRKLLLIMLYHSGLQLFFSVFMTFTFSLLYNNLQPTSMAIVFIVTFTFLSSVSSYHSSRLMKYFKLNRWLFSSFLTCSFLPMLYFIHMLVYNLIISNQTLILKYSLSHIFSVMSIWLFACLPLSLLGSYFGTRKQVLEFSTKVKLIPRQLPNNTRVRSFTIALFSGCLPFVVYFLFQNLFPSIQIGPHFLFDNIDSYLKKVIVIVIFMFSSIVGTYYMLCSENYQWWWKSYYASTVFSLLYFVSQFSEDISVVQYWINCFYSVILFLTLGFIGFTSSLFFNQYIFSSIKID